MHKLYLAVLTLVMIFAQNGFSQNVKPVFVVYSFLDEKAADSTEAQQNRSINEEMFKRAKERVAATGFEVRFYKQLSLDHLPKLLKDPRIKAMVFVGHANASQASSTFQKNKGIFGAENAFADVQGRNILSLLLNSISDTVEFLAFIGCYSGFYKDQFAKPGRTVLGWDYKVTPLETDLVDQKGYKFAEAMFEAGLKFGNMDRVQATKEAERKCIKSAPRGIPMPVSSYCVRRFLYATPWVISSQIYRKMKKDIQDYLAFPEVVPTCTGERTCLKIRRQAENAALSSGYLYVDGQWRAWIPALKPRETQELSIPLSSSSTIPSVIVFDSAYIIYEGKNITLGAFEISLNQLFYSPRISILTKKPLGITSHTYDLK